MIRRCPFAGHSTPALWSHCLSCYPGTGNPWQPDRYGPAVCLSCRASHSGPDECSACYGCGPADYFEPFFLEDGRCGIAWYRAGEMLPVWVDVEGQSEPSARPPYKPPGWVPEQKPGPNG